MKTVEFVDWENICLDTSIILSYLAALRGNSRDKRCAFVMTLVDYLNNNKTRKGKSRQFYVSAITISEMYDKSTDKTKVERIVNKMRVNNMTFISFDTDIAEFMTHNYHILLGTDKQMKHVRELNWPEENLLTAREWITKDLMIIATAHYSACDVVLTLDGKNFAPTAEKIDYFCSIVLEENFNINGNYIHEYKPKL